MKRRHADDPAASAADAEDHATAATTRFTSYRPATGGASAALQSGSAALGQLLVRSRSLGTTAASEEQKEGERGGSGGGGGAEKRRRTDDGEEEEDGADQTAPSLAPAATSPPLRVRVPSDPLVVDDDDFFASMMSEAPQSTGPVSARLASASFFRNLDELREQNKSAAASKEGAADDGAQFATLPFDDPPLDWNLHSKIRFTSDTPFTWVEERSIEHQSDGLTDFVSWPASAASDDATVPPLRELHHALHYCTFPSTPLTKHHPLTGPFQIASLKPVDARTHADQLAIGFVKKMWIQWEDSFRSLYYRLRLPQSSPSHVDHFYTCHRSPFAFTCLFLAAEDDDPATEPSVIISRSNRAFRLLLQKSGVRYARPNSSLTERPQSEAGVNGSAAAAAVAVSHTTVSDAALQSLVQQRRDDRLERDEDLSPASVLLVKGRQDLHCLYDFLLHHDRRELHLPTLLASCVFLNSTPQSLNLVRVGSQSRTTAAAAARDAPTSRAHLAAPPMQTEYVLDITGPIMPRAIVRLLSLLRRTQKGRFQAHLSSDFPGRNLNCVDDIVQMDQLRRHPSIALCHQSSLRSSTVVHLVGRQSVSSIGSLKRVKCEEGQFYVDIHYGSS